MAGYYKMPDDLRRYFAKLQHNAAFCHNVLLGLLQAYMYFSIFKTLSLASFTIQWAASDFV